MIDCLETSLTRRRGDAGARRKKITKLFLFFFSASQRLRVSALFFFLCCYLPYPADASSLTREADAYFEAKNYPKAIEAYQKLAQEPTLQPWQKAALNFNLALSQLKTGDLSNAIQTLQQIQPSSPLVLLNVNATLSSIHLTLAKTKGIKNDPTTLNWLKDALQEVDEASKAYCLLQKLEEAKTCSPSEELLSLRHSIENQWKQFSNEGFASNAPPETKIYMQNALHWIQKNSRTPNSDPFTTLENAIEDQEYALSINRLYKQLENPSEEIQYLIKNAQIETLLTAEPFYAQVLEKEKEDYPQSCQCHPWDAVIPSFEEGYRRAKWKLPIISVQEEILRYWKQSKENATKQKETPVKPEQEPEQTPSKIQDVFREIEQMDQDDKQPKQQIKQLSGKGVKPW